MTRDDPRVVCAVPIGISYASDLDKARAILMDLAGKRRTSLADWGLEKRG